MRLRETLVVLWCVGACSWATPALAFVATVLLAQQRCQSSGVLPPRSAGGVFAGAPCRRGVARPASVRNTRISAGPTVIIEQDEASVGKKLCSILEENYAAAVASKGSFFFSISGGSMLKMLSYLEGKSSIDWGKCTMGFVSHRAVPLDSDGATYHKARAVFLQSWMDQGLKVIAPTGSGDAQKEADVYIEAMKAAAIPFNADGLAEWDLLLIGVGTDGHVGSVYPALPDVKSSRQVLPATSGTGKITMSLAAMRAAKVSVVACAGKSVKAPLGKAGAMVRCLESSTETPMTFPARALRDSSTWLLCQDSACLLKNKY